MELDTETRGLLEMIIDTVVKNAAEVSNFYLIQSSKRTYI
jgi:hypothetical protein